MYQRGRNYFVRPNQGTGRSASSYKRGNWSIEDHRPRDPWMSFAWRGAAVLAIYFAFQFLR